ncbi:MAG: WYL domain-containing transcriptional regulator [Fibrobacter sp.]|jgi:predicted DNA-binding transcriptional regulator YafY|uniref:helix-turn-helix transcriptional regulator n=1 Tax=Fibrobacter sp. UWP2 TaxID=1896216 RepID=UPI000923D35E|nr:WYL domain-containing transcriptional regulator [Fibrobacter sp. UWP2]MBO7383830.1 WYL domain-containing transcriptional regulator [Fibrobacter sp.]SHJ23743.1 Predicted DNA-binding transcriptional regulator YafY, contains an HTH and WYL domains [Fibrobacter sp. UWP2]
MAGYEKINTVKDLLKREMTVSQLATAIGRGPRTVFRYLELLRSENCGLHSHKRNGETVWVIQTEEKMNFNQGAVKQLEKIKKNMSDATPANVKNRKLLDKLIEALQTTNPDEFKPEAITTDRDLVLDYGPFSDNKIQDVMVNKLLDAIHKKLKIRVTYSHAGDKKVETMELSPVKVIMRIDTLYLVAADETYAQKNVFKNYLVENISNVTLTNKPIEDNLVFDAATHYKYTFGKYTKSDPVQSVSLLIKDGWLKNQFEKSHFNPPVVLRRDSGKRDVVDMKIRVTPDFKTWLLGMLPHVQILKPESLRDEMKKLLKDTLEEM